MALDLLRELATAIPDAAYGWSSIAALNALASSPDLAFCPMVFGFNTYARDARAGAPLRFAAPPLANDPNTRGAIAGGTGLAVSAASQHRAAAIVAVAYLSSATSQIRNALAGGQPARIEAWADPAAGIRNGHFFSDCRATMAGAKLRPRYAGYIALQNAAGDLIASAARDRSLPAHLIIDKIDAMHRNLRSSVQPYNR
jgi:multiple sugar transport system substrate-binding protein